VEGELTAETQRFAEIRRDKDLDRKGNNSVKKGSASGKQGEREGSQEPRSATILGSLSFLCGLCVVSVALR